MTVHCGHDKFFYEHVIIFCEYLIIAYQFYEIYRSESKLTRHAKAVIYMLFIFVFCGLCGYVYQFLNPHYYVEKATLWIHIINTAMFIRLGQARVVALGVHKDGS